MKHPYAHILIAIAEGKEIQWNKSQGGWETQSPDDTLHEITHGEYSPERYRIKPATILINGVECEAPGDGDYSLTVSVALLYGPTKQLRFTTQEARDAAYAALIKPFGEQA